MDRKNFLSVKESIVTIYEDRLVAKGVLFEISHLIYEKELAIIQKDKEYFSGKKNSNNEEINTLVLTFEQTKLTRQEETILNRLKENLEGLF